MHLLKQGRVHFTFLLAFILLPINARAADGRLTGSLQKLFYCPGDAEVCIALYSSAASGILELKGVRGGKPVTAIRTDRDGNFQTSLAPGRYRLRLISVDRDDADKLRIVEGKSVFIRPGKTSYLGVFLGYAEFRAH